MPKSKEKALAGKIYWVKNEDSDDENDYSSLSFVKYNNHNLEDIREAWKIEDFRCHKCNGVINWIDPEEDEQTKTSDEELGAILGSCSQCCNSGYVVYPMWAVTSGPYNDEDCGDCIVCRKEVV